MAALINSTFIVPGATRRLEAPRNILQAPRTIPGATRRLQAPRTIPGATRRLQAPRRRLSTRCSVSPDPRETLFADLQTLRHMVSPSVVGLFCSFDDDQNLEIPLSSRCGTGVFVDPTLIVTSARLVGHVYTVDDTERGSILHKCLIAGTVAVNMEKKVFRTIPAAVHLARDVAVLKVIGTEEEGWWWLPPPCKVANAVPKEGTPLLGIARHENFTRIMALVAQCESADRRIKAPWPLNDDLDWINFGVRDPTLDVPLSDFWGAPWFNFDGEVIGMASWAATAADGYTYGYAVPAYSMRSTIAYARTRSPDDPIIMDDSIDSLTIGRHLDDKEIPEPGWTTKHSSMLL